MADRTVGTGYTYSSIEAARAAASSGDVLIVKTNENVQSSALTLDKNLTITTDIPVQSTALSDHAAGPRMDATGGVIALTVNANVTWEYVAILYDERFNVFFNGGTCTFRHCVVKTSYSSDSGALITTQTDGVTANFENVLALGHGNGLFMCHYASTTSVFTAKHVTAIAAGSVAAAVFSGGSSGAMVCDASIGYASSGQAFSGNCTGEDNAGSDASAPGSNARDNITSSLFTSVTIATANAALRGLNGGLLPGVADYSVTPDIAGNARPLATGFPIDPGCAVCNPTGLSILSYAEAAIVSSASSLTFSLIVPASIHSTIVLLVEEYTGVSVSSADWNGGGMTHKAAGDASNATISSEAWVLGEAQGSGTGSHTLTVNFSGSATRAGACAYVVARAADAATVAPTYDSANGASAATTVSATTAATTGGLFHLRAANSDDGAVLSTPSALRSKVTGSFNAYWTACRATSGGSDSVTWDRSDATTVLTSIALKPGTGGGKPWYAYAQQ